MPSGAGLPGWDLGPCSLWSGCLGCRFFVWKESLSLFFSAGMLSHFEEWVALGLWHLMCDLCPLSPQLCQSHHLLIWGWGFHAISHVGLDEGGEWGAEQGFQPSPQFQCPPLDAPTGPQIYPLISKRRSKCVFLLVSKNLYVSAGDCMSVYGGQKCIHGSWVCEFKGPTYRYECTCMDGCRHCECGCVAVFESVMVLCVCLHA